VGLDRCVWCGNMLCVGLLSRLLLAGWLAVAAHHLPVCLGPLILSRDLCRVVPPSPPTPKLNGRLRCSLLRALHLDRFT
jgi:hypothetical protein